MSNAGLQRRSFIGGLLGVVAALVRATSIMPVRSITPNADWIERQWRRGFQIIDGREMEIERTVLLEGPYPSVITNCVFTAASRFTDTALFDTSKITAGSAITHSIFIGAAMPPGATSSLALEPAQGAVS